VNASVIASLVIAVLSSGALAALATGWQNKKKTAAETTQIGAATLTALDPIVANWLERMQAEITELQKEVAQLRLINQQLIRLLDEHDIPAPPLP
jgi:gas vesicle protein